MNINWITVNLQKRDQWYSLEYELPSVPGIHSPPGSMIERFLQSHSQLEQVNTLTVWYSILRV